jgi:hypothetical protein
MTTYPVTHAEAIARALADPVDFYIHMTVLAMMIIPCIGLILIGLFSTEEGAAVILKIGRICSAIVFVCVCMPNLWVVWIGQSVCWFAPSCVAAGHLPDSTWVPDGTEVLYVGAAKLLRYLQRRGLGPLKQKPATKKEEYSIARKIYGAAEKYETKTSDSSSEGPSDESDAKRQRDSYSTGSNSSGSSWSSSSLSSSSHSPIEPSTPPVASIAAYVAPIVYPPSQALPTQHILAEMLKKIVASEAAERQAEDDPAKIATITLGNCSVHKTYYERPIWTLDGQQGSIETMRIEITPVPMDQLHTYASLDDTATVHGAQGTTGQVPTVDKIFNVANGLQLDAARGRSTNNGHVYAKALRVEVTYEGGKRDTHRSLQQWRKTALLWEGEYKDKEGKYTGPIVKSMRIELCNHVSYNMLRSVGYRVRASHGFPSIIEATDLVRMDLMRTNGTCAALSYFIWWSLVTLLPLRRSNSDSVDDDTKPTTVLESWRSYDDMRLAYKEFKHKHRALGISLQWTTDSFRQVFPGCKLRQYFEDDEEHMQEIQDLKDGDFTDSNTCHLLISRSMHASVIWPMSLLNNTWKKYIHNKMLRTYDRAIVTKPLGKHTEPYEDINTLDIECLLQPQSNEDMIHKPQLLCVLYKYQQLTFTSEHKEDPIDLFMRWVLTQGVSMEFWVHNLPYDGAFFSCAALKYCNDSLIHPAKLLSSSHGLISSTFHLVNGKVLKLRDSFKHLPESLNNLAMSFFPNDDMLRKGDIDVLKLKRPRDFWDKSIIDYCLNDCTVLQRVLVSYQHISIRSHGINPLRYATLSSYAKNSFLHGPHGLNSSHSLGNNVANGPRTQLYTLAPKVDEYIRTGSHGGRTEALHRGTVTNDTGEILMLDYNSMYPSVMSEELPHGKAVYIDPTQCMKTHSMTRAQLSQWLSIHKGFYDVYVTREPQLKHSLFAYSTTDTKMFNAEETDTLIYALRLGYRFKVLKGYTFSYAPYMKHWVKHYYRDKVDATNRLNAGDATAAVQRSIAKSVLNNAYGAYGTKWRGRVQHVTYGSRFIKQLCNNETIGMSTGEVIGGKYRVSSIGSNGDIDPLSISTNESIEQLGGLDLEDQIAQGHSVHMERDWTKGIWCGTETTDALFDDINVAISSCITSRARLKLYKGLIEIEARGLEVLYMDTDCYMVRDSDRRSDITLQPEGAATYIETTLKDMIHPTRLGALKVQAHISSATLESAKAYTYTTIPDTTKAQTHEQATVSRLKGIKLKDIEASQLTIPKMLNTLLKGEDVQIRTNKIYKPKSDFFSRFPIITKTITHTLKGLTL